MENEDKYTKVVVDNSERFSISKKLRNENRSNDLFEIMLNSISL